MGAIFEGQNGDFYSGPKSEWYKFFFSYLIGDFVDSSAIEWHSMIV